MSGIDETNGEALFDQWIHQVVETDVEETIRTGLDDTAVCVPQMLLHRQAPSGFLAEWRREGHPDGCRHCRRIARNAFHDADPGFWILQDRENQTLPQWWRQSIEDYLETAPRLVRFVAGAGKALREGRFFIRPEDLSARSIARLAVKGPLTLEGSNYDDEYPRERVDSAMGENDLVAVLWMVTSRRKKPNGEPEEVDLVIEVNDLSLGPARTVQTGLAGIRSLFLNVELSPDYRGIVRGEVTATLARVSALIGPEGGKLQVLPPVELSDEDGGAHP